MRESEMDADVTLLTEVEAAELLRVSVKCLRAWRQQKRDLKWVTLGTRLVRYRLSDLRAWIEGNVRDVIDHSKAGV